MTIDGLFCRSACRLEASGSDIGFGRYIKAYLLILLLLFVWFIFKTDHLISELKKYYATNTADTDKETCEDSHTDSFTTATSEHETTTTEV